MAVRLLRYTKRVTSGRSVKECNYEDATSKMENGKGRWRIDKSMKRSSTYVTILVWVLGSRNTSGRVLEAYDDGVFREDPPRGLVWVSS